jgi:hypothetical protein
VGKLAAFFPRFQAHAFVTKHGAYGGWAKQNIWLVSCLLIGALIADTIVVGVVLVLAMV